MYNKYFYAIKILIEYVSRGVKSFEWNDRFDFVYAWHRY